MENNKFVIYCRVSTSAQGESGLGLDAQLDACRKYVERVGGTILGEFHDVKSGSSKNRKGLNDALSLAKANEATIVFSKLDRLSRESEYAHKIRNSGVQLYFLDFPQINSLLFSILVAVAQYEKELGQKRTTDALNQIKRNIERDGYHTSKRGNAITQLGHKKGEAHVDEAQLASAEARKAIISNNQDRRRQWLLIKDLRSRGDSLDAIVSTLNATGEKTPKGGTWSKGQVSAALNSWGRFFENNKNEVDV
jgi:DNA invertase Pin-like site-specific DNA recombinase